jgi:hypothetical protein
LYGTKDRLSRIFNSKVNLGSNRPGLEPKFDKHEFHYPSNANEQKHIYSFLKNMKDEEDQFLNGFNEDDSQLKYKPFMTHTECKFYQS